MAILRTPDSVEMHAACYMIHGRISYCETYPKPKPAERKVDVSLVVEDRNNNRKRMWN